MRWEEEAEQALKQSGYGTIVARDSEDDYQGWVTLLAHGENGYAVLSWSYGSCSGCDPYENLPLEQVIASLAGDIRAFATEEEARSAFVNAKGW